MDKVHQIAADIIANLTINPNGFTTDTLVAHWANRIEWLGLKVGGKAWNRELLDVARSGWIASLRKTSIAIPPSEETLNAGGFLGGEIIPSAELRAAAEADFSAKFGVVA